MTEKNKSGFSTGECSELMKKSFIMWFNLSHSVFVEPFQCCNGRSNEDAYPKFWMMNITWIPQLQVQNKYHRRKLGNGSALSECELPFILYP